MKNIYTLSNGSKSMPAIHMPLSAHPGDQGVQRMSQTPNLPREREGYRSHR